MATVQIWVKLDKDATDTAKVTLESRDKKVPSGDKIKWHKKDKDDDFNITDFEPQGEDSVFKEVKISNKGKKATCKFNPGDAETEYPYTLSVESGDVTYDTTDPSVQAEDGKPVIRN